MATIATECFSIRTRSLAAYPVLMTCGHTVLRLMHRPATTPAGAQCEVCRGDMTPADFQAYQNSVKRYR